MYVVKRADGTSIPISLCARCMQDVFNEDSWKKMFGTHPGGTPLAHETMDACFDGEHKYGIIGLGGKRLPKKRGPILRFRLSIQDLKKSMDDHCGFCHIVASLDTAKHLKSDMYDKAQIDLQLFKPDWMGGEVYLPLLLRITLTLQRTEDNDVKDASRSKFVAVTPRQVTYDVGDSLSQDPVSDSASISDRDDVTSEGQASASQDEVAIHEGDDATSVGNDVQSEDRDSTSEEDDNDLVAVDLLHELKSMIEQCKSHHTSCGSSETTRLPVRVIDVNVSTNLGDVKVVENVDRPHGDYVALSYVWGTSSTLRLLQDTKDSLMTRIPFDTLPQTIQDAVEVTRSLGVQYLWVDALCILQDSGEDKELQIPFMNEYYQDATAVISASGAVDVHGGFLDQGQTSQDVLMRIEEHIFVTHSQLGPIPYRILVSAPWHPTLSICVLDTDPRIYNYDDEPINKRGWTLQESALARRLIIFPSIGGVVMRCREGHEIAGEVFSDPYHEFPVELYSGMRQDAKEDENIEDDLFERWTSVVEDYSRRFLSHPDDILIAIGALAQEFHSSNAEMLGPFLGGLWSNMILKGLLWHIVNPDHRERDSYIPPTRHSLQYCAPSWSWASCGHPVAHRIRREPDVSFGNYDPGLPKWCAEILSHGITSRIPSNPFGAVTSGYLKIKGTLMPIKIVSKDTEHTPDGFETETIAFDIGKSEHRPGQTYIFAPDSLDALPLIRSSCFWLPIYDATRGRFRGLIVRETEDGRFRRLGFVEVSFHDDDLSEGEEKTIRLI
ncbi:hypothetical protein MMC25_007905 [Agyrium rufum]|nr:hypothetical protein [Agyrium rufum]